MTTIGHDTYQTGNVPELSSVAGMLSSLPIVTITGSILLSHMSQTFRCLLFSAEGASSARPGWRLNCMSVCVCGGGGGGGGGMCEGKRGGKEKREGR